MRIRSLPYEGSSKVREARRERRNTGAGRFFGTVCAVSTFERNGSVKTAADAACPDDQSASGKQAFLRLPESPGPGLPLAIRQTEPRLPSGESTHPPFLRGWPRRTALYSHAPDACRLQRDSHKANPILPAHPGIAGEQPRPALCHTFSGRTIPVVASLRTALPGWWA